MTNPGKKIVYITREIERALGLEPGPEYLIISNATKYAQEIKKKYPDYVTLIDNSDKGLLGTTDLIARPETARIVTAETAVLVFKNTVRVESEISSHKWRTINPRSALSEKIENKLSQIRWLGTTGSKYLPTHTSKITKNITWKSNPFVIQWAHGHTGDGTILVKTPEELQVVQSKFPERMARLSNYIEGPSLTVNVVVTPTRILMGNISYQITGLAPFTDNRFSTVGNDWALAKKILGQNETNQVKSIVSEIGSKMQNDGWKGLFGIDFVLENKTKKVYLIEINARQPASATFESTLQVEARKEGQRGLTTFEAHIRALLDLPIDQDLVSIDDGAQIVQRITQKVQGIFDDTPAKLTAKNFDVIVYENTKANEDLARIQSRQGIMENHDILNAKGREIAEIIKGACFNLKV